MTKTKTLYVTHAITSSNMNELTWEVVVLVAHELLMSFDAHMQPRLAAGCTNCDYPPGLTVHGNMNDIG